MSNQLSSHYIPFGDVILRTHVLPISNVRYIPDDLGIFFKKLLKDDFFKDAIYLASPDLYSKILKWLSNEISVKDEEKLILTLLKYWLRMSARCTPFGIFAGCSLGSLSDLRTEVVLNDRKSHLRYSRLDMNYLCELADHLSKESVLKSRLKYSPNNSLYRISDTYRYVEYESKDKIRTYRISEISLSKQLEKILTSSSKGMSIKDLSDLIVDGEVSSEEANDFIDELIHSQVLVNDLEPPLTGIECLEFLVTKIRATCDDLETLGALDDIQILLKKEPGIVGHRKINHLVSSILNSTSTKDLIQTDLFLSTHNNVINKRIIDDILKSMQKLTVLAPKTKGGALQKFKQTFLDRFDQREMSLTFLLDAEVGIGYDVYNNDSTDNSPLLFGMNFPRANYRTPFESFDYNKIEELRLKKLKESLILKKTVVTISDNELNEFASSEINLPDSAYLMGTLLGKDPSSMDLGQFKFILSTFSGPSAATLLGRFCHGDPDLNARVNSYIKDEEERFPDSIFAEVVHLPQSRVGNILSRPVLRKFEIVYLGASGASSPNQIHINDLFVSVIGDEIVLTSKRLGKRVYPRMSTAHNYKNGGHPIYQFLCDLQYQKTTLFTGWDWGALRNSIFLPRVVFENVILCRAQWSLKASDHPLMLTEGVFLSDYFQKLLNELSIPRFVLLKDGDNELPLDLSHIQCLKIVRDNLKKWQKVTLIEFLNTPENCFVTNKNGEIYGNEIIIPIKKAVHQQVKHTTKVAISELNYPRTFTTGSEWLYVKIYCGCTTAEKILKSIIKPLIEHLMEVEAFDQWFFIRYADPENHLRIRFKGTHWEYILKKIHSDIQDYIEQNLVSRFQTDTYEREVERYGVSYIGHCETIFYWDSQAVLEFIDLLYSDEDENYRWIFSLRGIDSYLNDFGFSLSEKLHFSTSNSQSFFKEFGENKQLRKQLDDKYRKEGKLIRSHLDSNKDQLNDIEEMAEILSTRSKNLYPVVKEIMVGLINNKAERFELVSNIIHMYINRLFPINQRKHEFIVYYFISNYYKSQIAIQNKKNN